MSPVHPCVAVSVGSAPFNSSTRTTGSWPYQQAQWSDVRLCPSTAFTLAPFWHYKKRLVSGLVVAPLTTPGQQILYVCHCCMGLYVCVVALSCVTTWMRSSTTVRRPSLAATMSAVTESGPPFVFTMPGKWLTTCDVV